MSTNVRPERKPKVQPIVHAVDLAEKGLPENLDAERFVLGSILAEDSRFEDAAALNPGDFSRERHQRIFKRMLDLRSRGEHIDRVTVAEELARHNELGDDGFSFLAALDDGMPHITHLDSYVGIVQKKSTLRRAIVIAHKLSDECLLDMAEPAEILAAHMSEVETLRVTCSGHGKIQRIEDLESIFANRAPVEYLVKPELPAKSIVCLTGDSESGKTTLACAWAREILGSGHAVLILDRDRNPRDRICDRLERLGVRSDGERLRIWDCEQQLEAPQPNHPIVVDWVTRMVQSGHGLLVVVDSLVSFFEGDEDENSAVDMRALFDRCRALTKLGATVIIIHHTNRNGQARGSSDFRPASDQAFLVSNSDRNGGRLLDVITLECEKSRYGLSDRIEYQYAGGQMMRVQDIVRSKSVSEDMVQLLKANPGTLMQAFVDLARRNGVGRNEARDFLSRGAENGTIEVRCAGRGRRHFWRGSAGETEDSDPERPLG